MSDNATLVERLLDMGETQRIQEASLKVEYRSETNIGLEAAARIAELEAEAASHREIEEMVLRDKAARIAELEAERDKHKANAERLYVALNDLSANARPALARIAELEAAVLAEREACAAVADRYEPYGTIPEATDIAASIRARARLALERGSHASVQRNLEARIAELEAERDELIFSRDSLRNAADANAKSWLEAAARIAELEAEEEDHKAAFDGAFDRVAHLTARIAELDAAVDEIARQRTTEEHAAQTDDPEATGDVEYGYNSLIGIARRVSRARPAP